MAFYEKQKRKQVTSGYKIKMSGLHHGLLGGNRCLTRGVFEGERLFAGVMGAEDCGYQDD